jgi:transcriptional regulator with XRE-family HTH domain
MQFGSHLRKLRKAKGLTQAELAEKIGITQSVVAAYERGAKKPEMDRIPALAKALGVTLEGLYGVGGHEDKETAPVHKNRRTAKVQDLFDKLAPMDQCAFLKQIKLLAQHGHE